MRSAGFVVRATVCLIASLALAAEADTITVNSLGDSAADEGECTLREAITAANTNAASGAAGGECAAGNGSDVIEFSVAGTIQPGSQLPTITTVIHIDGYSAPGASVNMQPLAQGTNAVLVVEIDGINAGNVPGLSLSGAGAAGSIVEGLVINKSGGAACCATAPILVQVAGASTTVIRGNFLGTNTAGTAARPTGSRGIFVGGGSANIVIGSDTGGAVDPAAVNLVSGNGGDGLTVGGGSNLRIRGNLVGTNAGGAAALANSGHGMFVDALIASYISDNVLSGNSSTGLWLRQTSSDVHIERNFIGTNAAGTVAVPNSLGGIRVTENPNVFPRSITDVDIVENLVAFNNCNACSGGIALGPSNSANTVEGIRLAGNRVYSNQGLEIDLALTNGTNNGLVFGVTENDPGDADDGANTLQNFPVLTGIVTAGLSADVDYTFNGEANTEFTFEFFHTSACDPSGYGGAMTPLGTDVRTTDGSGDTGGQVPVSLPATYGYITATATQVDNGTSEFSLCLRINDSLFGDGFESVP